MPKFYVVSCLFVMLAPFGVSAQFTLAKSAVTCYGLCNATAQISPGTGYRYRWSNGDSTSFVTNLCAGAYTCTVTDTTGAPLDTLHATVIQPPQLTIATATVNTECPGANDGGIVVTAAGGSPPYNFSILKPPSTGAANTDGDFTHLDSGQYIATVVDNNECVRNDTAAVGISSSACTGVEELEALNAFSLYPNPAMDEVMIEIHESVVDVTLQITDISGEEISKSQIPSSKFQIANSKLQIPISILATGVYFVKLNCANGQSAVRELFIER